MVLLLVVFTINLNGMTKNAVASDFQIYQLLSTIKPEDSFYLPRELMQIISVNAYHIEELHCYQEYGKCVDGVAHLLQFIKTRAIAHEDSASTVYIIKKCLAYSGKSLLNMRGIYNETVFHTIMVKPIGTEENFNYSFDVLCQIADNNIADILCVQNDLFNTPWVHAVFYARTEAIKKFITIAQDNQLKLTSTGYHDILLCIARTKKSKLAEWSNDPAYEKCVPRYQDEITQLHIIIELLKPHTKEYGEFSSSS